MRSIFPGWKSMPLTTTANLATNAEYRQSPVFTLSVYPGYRDEGHRLSGVSGTMPNFWLTI